MRKKPATPEAIEEFKKDYATMPLQSLAAKHGVTYWTVKSWASQFGFHRPYGGAVSREGPSISWDAAAPQDTSYEKLLELMKMYSEISTSILPKSRYTVSINRDTPIAITFSSDWQLGHPGVDYAAFDRDISAIVNTPNLYVYVGGDYVENMIADIFCARFQLDPTIQRVFFEKTLERILDHIIVVGSGNHDLWTEAAARYDPMVSLAEKLKFLYTDKGGLLSVNLGGYQYRIYRKHHYRFNSSINLTHSVKQMLRLEEDDFHVGVLEHGHVPAMEEFYYKGEKRVALKCGSYKVLWDEYAERKGFTGVKPLNPTIIIFPDKFEILSFLDMHCAIDVLKSLS